jgi:hypothetical protein
VKEGREKRMKMEKKMKKHERFMLRGLIHIDIALGGGISFLEGRGGQNMVFR